VRGGAAGAAAGAQQRGGGGPIGRRRAGDPRAGRRAPGGGGLPALVGAGVSGQDVVSQAGPFFAGAVDGPPAGEGSGALAPGRVRILDLHAAALVAVLRTQRDGSAEPVQVSVPDVLAELLGHEERFWQGSAQARGLMDGPHGLTAHMLRQIVAAGALLG